MSFTELIDFSKYGINFDYTPDTKKLPESIKNNILPVVFTNKTVTFTKGDDSEISMNLKTKLGAGSYGEAWDTDTEIEKGMPLIVKVISAAHIKNRNRLANYEYDIVQEVLIQIILYESTKNISLPEINLIGPFVPKLFLIGKDSKNFYIVSEKLDDSLFTILHGSNKIPTTEFIKTSTLHLSKMLIILYEKLKFNHRDLKADNIMYKIIDDKINVRFIDFGFSCIKYNNLFLSAISGEVYASKLHCNSKIRDMHAYLYSLLNYSVYRKTKCPIKRLINALIVIDDAELPESWSNSYNRFDKYNDNNNKMSALNSSCDVVFNVFSSLNFSSDVSCSNINSDWTKYLAKLYKSTVVFLTDDEYKNVSPELLDDFLLPFLKNNLEIIWKNNVSTDIFFKDFYYKLSDKVYSCDDSTNICKRVQFKAPNKLLPTLIDDFMKKELYKRYDASNEIILHKIVRNKESPYADTYLDIFLSKDLNAAFINSKPPKNGLTAYHIALNNNYTNAINKLAKYVDSTDLSNVDFIEALLKSDNDYIEKYPLKGQELLFKIIRVNNTKYNYLIKKYIDRIDKNILIKNTFTYSTMFKDFSALDVAIYFNNVDAIKMFLPYDFSVQKDRFIFNISKISDYEVIAPLLAKYFDESLINIVDESDNNTTPLINAVKQNNLLIVKKLINNPNIIISKQDLDGRTCLHYASYYASVYVGNSKNNVAFEIVKLLIDKYPALTDIKDKTGVGPGNKQFALAPNVREYIKTRKSGLFKKNPNIEKNKRDINKKVGGKRSDTKRRDKKSQRKTRKYN
jgi:hypothetical protein